MGKAITLKKISLITITPRENSNSLIDFIRIDTREMLSEEEAKHLNSLNKIYPQEQFKYTFHSIDGNVFYKENNEKELLKITKNKEENLGKRDIRLYAIMENGITVNAELIVSK